MTEFATAVITHETRNAHRPDTGNFQFASDRVIKRVTSLALVRLCIYFENGAGKLSLPFFFWQNEQDQLLLAFATSVFASCRNDQLKLRNISVQ